MKIAKLPNEEFVPIDDHGFVALRASISLEEVQETPAHELPAKLAEMASGANGMTEVEVKMRAIDGDAIVFDVSGCVRDLGVTIQDQSEFQNKEWLVEVTRIARNVASITVSGRTKAEAAAKAEELPSTAFREEDVLHNFDVSEAPRMRPRMR